MAFDFFCPATKSGASVNFLSLVFHVYVIVPCGTLVSIYNKMKEQNNRNTHD